MPSKHWSEEANWIWLSDYDDSKPDGQIVLFRKHFQIETKPTTPCLVHVTADTRYRLFVNGESVSFGPCKSYVSRWYYETVDIHSYLRPGLNCISARVLRFSSAYPGSLSMTRGPMPGLLVHCVFEGKALHTDTTWEAKRDAAVTMVPRSEWNYALGPPFLALNERVDASMTEHDWHFADSSGWTPAKLVTTKSMMLPVLEPWRLYERPIPNLPETMAKFDGVVTCEGSVTAEQWKDMISKPSGIQIPARSTVTVELESSQLTTGFLELHCTAGTGAKIRVMCAESYEQPLERSGPGAKRRKSDRTDHLTGKLYGPNDYYVTRAGLNVFEPFWFRTFRYIQLEISTLDDALTIHMFRYRKTNYPLQIDTTIQASPELEKMWEISLNTLQNCMHETFEDCPFYEQNQFIMDSRIQMLFSYQLSRDDRLARKTIHEFHASRRDDGLLEAQFPSPSRMIQIPQFSLFWILMLYDHMQYFGDRHLLKRYLGTMDGILDYFSTLLNPEGLIGQFDREAWPFVDWVKEWQGTTGILSMGIPSAYWDNGAATYNSLVYAFALNHAASVCAFVGRPDTAAEYRARAAAVNAAVNKHCYDGTLYLDGPNSPHHSQHTQIFAILSGAVAATTPSISTSSSTTITAAAALLRQTLTPPSNAPLPKCSYAFSFYVLQAAHQSGIYAEVFPSLMAPWRSMMSQNLTTWAEDDVMFRSDCHGWSASPLHEIVARLFGVAPAEPGYGRVRICPAVGLLPARAEGRFVTGAGVVTVGWDVEVGLVVGVENGETGEAVGAEKEVVVEVMIEGEGGEYTITPSKPLRFTKNGESQRFVVEEGGR